MQVPEYEFSLHCKQHRTSDFNGRFGLTSKNSFFTVTNNADQCTMTEHKCQSGDATRVSCLAKTLEVSTRTNKRQDGSCWKTFEQMSLLLVTQTRIWLLSQRISTTWNFIGQKKRLLSGQRSPVESQKPLSPPLNEKNISLVLQEVWSNKNQLKHDFDVFGLIFFQM